jgi:hypothetical protein
MATKYLVDVRTPMPDTGAEERAKQALAAVEAMTILSAADYEAAAAELARVKGQWDKTEADRKELKAPSLTAAAGVDKFFAPALAFLVSAEKIIKSKLDEWDTAQDALRLETQAKVDAAAAKQRVQLEQRADRAIASGKTEKAELLQQQASMVVAPVIAANTPKVAGLVKRQVWKFEITNPQAVPRTYCEPDVAKIRKQVNATGGDTNIPGVRVFPERNYGSKSAA